MVISLQLVGQRFGKLVVISQAENKKGATYWNCRCDCGIEKILIGGCLKRKRGGIRSCGCNKIFPALQLVGQRFGNYTVISKAKNDKSGSTYWNCVCDCGTKKRIRGYDLYRGRIKSCGCLRKEKSKETRPKSAINSIFYNYKRHASEKGRDFTLTKAEFGELIRQPCFYCGIEYSNTFTNVYTKEFVFYYNGIDRKDNTLGYTNSNVVSCCKMCNQWKKALSLTEFRDHILRLAKHIPNLNL